MSTKKSNLKNDRKQLVEGAGFGVETQVWQAAENDGTKMVNLETGEARDASSFKSNGTFLKVSLSE
jgi:hypothetical protein